MTDQEMVEICFDNPVEEGSPFVFVQVEKDGIEYRQEDDSWLIHADDVTNIDSEFLTETFTAFDEMHVPREQVRYLAHDDFD